jgi:hypothetical protein
MAQRHPTPTYRTAEQIADSLESAIEAVRDYLGTDREVPAAYAAGDRARRAVDIAITVDGITPAQIATRAGVRQLLVAGMVRDPQHRARALAAARHDAQRYLDEVVAEMRMEAWRQWEAADGQHGAKTRIAANLRVTRTTLDAWLAGSTGEEQHDGNA